MTAWYFNVLLITSVMLLSACSQQQTPIAEKTDNITLASSYADTVLHNGTIYTADDSKPTVTALALKNGRVIYRGDFSGLKPLINDVTRLIDLQQQTATPGFIETHAHLSSLGKASQTLDLTKAKSYQDIVQLVEKAVSNTPVGQVIIGRGWHQNKWEQQPSILVKGFQTHAALSAVSPDNPVLLTHASGHAVFANARAMNVAGVDSSTEFTGDGEIIKDHKGNPTGIFNENAAKLFATVIAPKDPSSLLASRVKQLTLGMQEALAAGITSLHDAGNSAVDIEALMTLGNSGKLPLRLYLMLSSNYPELISSWFAKGPLLGYFDNHLTIRAVKIHGDGALGSRGAWLLDEYTDRPGHYGMPTYPMDGVEKLARESLAAGFQLAVHAIGDRTNREVLDRFALALSSNPNPDHRFRIEHAQHISIEDIPRFGQLGVIAAVQSVHMSSDRPWATKRLGNERIEQGAYVWQKLLKSGAVVINGTDAPVEPITPLASFYAAVTRQTLSGTPAGGYEPSQKMSRQQALKSYTLDAAYGEFNEKIKGSLEVGKLADITVFSRNIMTIPAAEILNTNVTMTIVGGEIKYQQ